MTAADLAAHRSGVVGAAMHRELPVVATTTPLDEVLEPLERHGAVLVGDRGAIVGVLSADQLATFTALHRS